MFHDTVCAYISAGRLTLAKPGDDLFIPQIAPWLRAAGVLTMVTNIAVTAMIGERFDWTEFGVSGWKR